MQFSFEQIICGNNRVIGNWKTCFMSAVESVFRVCWEVLLLLLLLMPLLSLALAD
jgi:hypothetical protein